MKPYIKTGGNNVINCNTELVISDGSKLLMASLIDIPILTKKILSDIIMSKTITLLDRENLDFKTEFWTAGNFRYKSEKQDDLSHTIIYNTDINKYAIDWNNDGKIKTVTKYLNNRLYIPITEEIVKGIIEYQDKENEKYSYSKTHIVKECEVYSNNPEYKDVKCYEVKDYYFKEYISKIETSLKDDFDWDSIETIEDYIMAFIDPIKQRLNKNIKTLYNPKKVNQIIFKGKKTPFKGQIPIIQSGIEVLKNEKFVYLALEQGTGKTISSIKVLNGYYDEIGKKNPVIFIQAPAITLSQWCDEIKDSYSEDVNIFTIKKTIDFIKLHNKTDFKFDKPTFILCGKETFKLQYKISPAIKVRQQRIKMKEMDEYYASRYTLSSAPDWAFTTVEKLVNTVVCPDCGLPLKNEGRSQRADVYFEEKDFKKTPNKSNYKCGNCESILWSATYDKTMKTSVIDYIKRKHIKFDCVVCDEIQESNNSGSIIGNGTRTLVRNHAKKVVLLSGTPNNGYSSSIYNVLFSLIPNTLFDNNIADEKEFIQKYGALQAITNVNNERRSYYSSGRAEIKDSDYKEIEGINPLVFTKYLSKNFIIADLMDLGENLPPLNEYYIPVTQDDDLIQYEKNLFEDIKKANSFNAKMYIDSIIKHYVNNPFTWNELPIVTENGEHLIHPTPIENRLLNKEEELLRIIKSELKEGRKCWIYVDFNNGGEYMSGETLPNRLERILKENGINTFHLRPSVKTYDRKEIIDKNKDKYEVFMCNRKLVEVGLNMQFCPTYINYCPSYFVNSVSQANRRGWRVNSTLENRVYNLYYEDTCEQEIINRYQRKVAESNAIMGRFDVELQNEEIRTASKFAKELSMNI